MPGYLTSFWVFWERFGDKEFRSFGFNEEREKARPRWRSQREGSDFFRAWHFPAYGRGYAAIRGTVGQAQPYQWLSPTSIPFKLPPLRPDQSMILCNVVQERLFLDIRISSVLIHKVHLSLSPNARVNGPCGCWLGQCTSTGSNRAVLRTRYSISGIIASTSFSSRQSPGSYGFSWGGKREEIGRISISRGRKLVMQLSGLAVRARVHRVHLSTTSLSLSMVGRVAKLTRELSALGD